MHAHVHSKMHGLREKVFLHSQQCCCCVYRAKERERERRGGGRERQIVYCLQSLLLVSLTLIESIKLLKL